MSSLFFERHASVRRPPRPVPRGPRERRALHRSRVSSADRRDAHPARAEARTKPRSLHRRRGAHVMRIAELTMIRPPLAAGGLVRLRARGPPVVRLPFTRSWLRRGFRPYRYWWRASLSPRTFCRLLQYDDARAPTRAARFLVLWREVTNLSPPSPSSAPSLARGDDTG
jgi:hypothetical protein